MTTAPVTGRRASAFARQLIAKYQIDCTGLTVLTEAASGSYLYNPLVPILAGARRVIAFCRDSTYARVDEVRSSMSAVYDDLGLQDRYDFRDVLTSAELGDADIVTNSGHLRPLDADFLGRLKDTTVVPLMWEPWELRPGEIDVAVAKRQGILILGTNEHEAPCDMRPYSFLTALHLMMAHGAAINDDRALVIGNQPTLAMPIEQGLRANGVAARRIGADATAAHWLEAVRWSTYVLVAEHADDRVLLGRRGVVETRSLLEAGATAVGVIAGRVDRDDLEAHGISVFPQRLAPAGYMSYSPAHLGPYPVMDLFAAGIKVGEAMARARLRGMDVRDAARFALANAPAMDLEGGLAWT